MKYCARCIIPDTRPNITLDSDGVCNACRSFAQRKSIDWSQRKKDFKKVVENTRMKSSGYDCLVPVSGGKDSFWQIITCLEYGLNPLAVTWKTPGRTQVGQQNLEKLISLGVDHIDYQINPKVEKKFMVMALKRFGSTAVPMHMALFNIPLSIAVRFGIPMVVWGENSAFEYGCQDEAHTGFRLDSTWLKTYGVTHGTTAGDWISEELTKKELTPYYGPSETELEQAGVLAVFLGYYFPWDPDMTRTEACKHGFTSSSEGPKTGYWDYADIDDDFISIHHWLKWYKFGFTRLFDNLSVEIRNGRLSRDQAVEIVRSAEDQKPHEDIAAFCRYTDITLQEFFAIAEKFRNTEIWKKDPAGIWHIPEFLIKGWEWS